MKITAQRVRDGLGLRPLVPGFFHDEMGTCSLRDSGESVWVGVELAKFFSSTLLELTCVDSFNLISRRLIDIEKYSPSTKVLAATKRGIRIIEIEGRQFLNKGYGVYERKVP